MENLILTARAGAFGVVGRLHAGPPRATLLILLGAYPPRGQLHEAVDWFPEANVVVATLPGFGTPYSYADLPSLRVGFDHVIARLTPEGPVVVVGVSAGCLVTLGVRASNVCRHVAIEPFFETAGLWPLINIRRELEEAADGEENRKAARDFLWRFFGMGTDGLANRNYTDVLTAVNVPLDVILGAEPLQPERPLPNWPSFTSEDDRALLQAKPGVVLHQAPSGSGHGLTATPDGKSLLRRIMGEALEEADKRHRHRHA